MIWYDLKLNSPVGSLLWVVPEPDGVGIPVGFLATGNPDDILLREPESANFFVNIKFKIEFGLLKYKRINLLIKF